MLLSILLTLEVWRGEWNLAGKMIWQIFNPLWGQGLNLGPHYCANSSILISALCDCANHGLSVLSRVLLFHSTVHAVLATIAWEIQYLFQWDGSNLGKQFNDRCNQYLEKTLNNKSRIEMYFLSKFTLWRTYTGTLRLRVASWPSLISFCNALKIAMWFAWPDTPYWSKVITWGKVSREKIRPGIGEQLSGEKTIETHHIIIIWMLLTILTPLLMIWLSINLPAIVESHFTAGSSGNALEVRMK